MSENYIGSVYTGNITWLAARTLFAVRHGSHAYGTNTPTSDLDIRGAVIPPKEYLFGFMQHFEQAESKEPDLVLYDLRKFMTLAADGNPNVVEVLYVDSSDVMQMTPLGERLIEHRDLFLSQRMRFSFAGYAASQMKRIRTHHRWILHPPAAPPTRAEFKLPERTVIPKDQLQAAQSLITKKLDEWNIDFNEVAEGEREAALDRLSGVLAEMQLHSDGKYKAAARAVGYDENFLELLERERAYRTKQTEWEQFQTWKKTRNPVRSALEEKHGFDCYLDDTEFLTEHGWRLYDEIPEGVRLATLNRYTSQIEFQRPTERVAKDYNGPIIHFQPQHSNCAVTPNHRMFVSAAHRSQANNFSSEYNPSLAKWEIHPAETLLKERRTVFHCRIAGAPREEHYPIEDDYLLLLGAYVSEGSIGKRLKDGSASVIRLSQSEKGRLVPYLEQLSLRYAEKMTRFTFVHKDTWRKEECTELIYHLADRELAKRLEAECGAESLTKRLPAWVMQLSGAQAKLLIDVMLAGDGTKRPHSSVYYTASKQLADDLQALCVVSGIQSQIWGPYPDPRVPDRKMYQVYIGKSKEIIPVRIAKTSPNIKIEEVHNRKIVCFTVPNEILVTRRKGKIAIHGNTKHASHLVRLLRMCREILETGKVIVKRPDAQELLAIRNGAWTYDQLEEWSAKEDKALDEVMKTSKIPRSPNRTKLDALCIELVEASLK
jgi:predicted nucleotidyltransferase